MAGLSKKQLEIKNQALMDYIKAAICVLDDQTTEAEKDNGTWLCSRKSRVFMPGHMVPCSCRFCTDPHERKTSEQFFI